jgi:hypothetical protein
MGAWKRRGARGTGPRLLAVFLLLAGAGACAQRRDPVEIPNPAMDNRILSELERRLATEPSVNRSQMRVEVEGARVLLYGSVEGIGAWNCALRNAWLVHGVEGVADFLVIERGPPEVRCLAVRGPALSSAQGASGITLVPQTAGEPRHP